MTGSTGFKTEAELCSAFISAVPEGWTVYPESCGFDLVLVRTADAIQIGIEAKLVLNAKVLSQIVEYGYDPCAEGPDFRAVMVPSGKTGSLRYVCRMLGITIIEVVDEATIGVRERWKFEHRDRFSPALPRLDQRYWSPHHQEWLEWAPAKRLTLPEYVPDVSAGNSAPVQLTHWKIKAIKIAILLERRGSVTRADFKAIGIDYTRWIDPYTGWLIRSETPGTWTAGPHIGTFKAQHPVNYEQIAADFEIWAPNVVAA